MKRILFALLLFSGIAQGQRGPSWLLITPVQPTIEIGTTDQWFINGYTKINSRYQWIAGVFDSGLHVPSYNGLPTNRSGVWTASGAIAVDTANHRLYIYSDGWIRVANFSELGSTTTLQQVFDNEPGGSVLTKHDSIMLDVYDLKIYGRDQDLSQGHLRIVRQDDETVYTKGWPGGFDFVGGDGTGNNSPILNFFTKNGTLKFALGYDDDAVHGFLDLRDDRTFNIERNGSAIAQFYKLTNGVYPFYFYNPVVIETGTGPVVDARYKLQVNEGSTLFVDTVVHDGVVGIGTRIPHVSSKVEIVSTTKGFLLPRMTEAQRDAIGTPATGLMIYNTDDDEFNYYDGAEWTAIGSGGGGATTALDNLASVAINTALLPATSDATDLGSTTKQWKDLYLGEGQKIDWDNGDATLTQVGNMVTLAGADLTVPNATVSGLTSGRIVYASTAGLLAGDAGLQWDGNGVTITATGGVGTGLTITSTDASSYASANFITPTGGTGFQIGKYGASAASPNKNFFFEPDANGIGFFTNSTERLTISGTGSIGVGNATPDASAKVDIVSTTQGFLPPRMTTTQKTAISSPATGLVVYDTTLNKLCVYTGSAWETVTSL